MDYLYYLASFLLTIVILLFIVLIIKPTLAKKLIKYDLTRIKLLFIFIVLIIIFGSILSISEPESLKQARLEKEQQSQQTAVETIEAPTATESNQTLGDVNEVEQEIIDPSTYWHEVVEVVDGDTIKAKVDGVVESIRIIGIDAPETNTSNECYGNESTAKAKDLLTSKWVQLESDPTQDNRDRYKRLLRFVWFDDRIDFSKKMIEEGYVYEYTYDIPYKYQKEYIQAQSNSKAQSLGLWSSSTCSGLRVKPVTQTAPAPEPAPKPTTNSNCDPNYTPCVPNVSYDLDCKDIGFRVRVIGTDKHRFDGNNDGDGCESY